MPLQTDRLEPAARHARSRRIRCGSALLCVALAVVAAGCGSSESFSVSGIIQLDGRPVIAELLFEPLTEAGKRQGQSVTAVTKGDGRFEAVLPLSAEDSASMSCRISARIPRSSQAVSSAFDYEALPDKVVELRRELSPDQKLTLLITQ